VEVGAIEGILVGKIDGEKEGFVDEIVIIGVKDVEIVKGITEGDKLG
jgi:hypothetical protein